MKAIVEYRKANHLCLDCGEVAVKGKTRCLFCLQKIAGRQRMYEERKKSENPDEYYQKRRAYYKKWCDKNRDHVREYHRKWYEENYKSTWGEIW